MSRTLSIWRWQLIFTGSMLAVVVVIAAFSPHTFGNPLVALGLVVLVATTLATLMVPWPRIPQSIVVAVPLLDALAVGLATSAPGMRIELLWVFPVAWLASYFALPWVFAGIGFISACLLLFTSRSGEPADVLVRVLIVVLTLSFLGTTIRIGAQRSRAARRLLQRQSEQAERAAERAQTQEQRVTQVIDALDVALVVVNADGRILKMNDAYRTLYGRDRFGAALPSTAVEYDERRGAPLPPERTTLSLAARGEELRSERIWLFDQEGRWRALQASTQRLADATARDRSTLLIIDDVTALIEAAEERRTLTAIVSHELRNPLMAILGHVDLLRERDDLPGSVVVQVEVISNASERMQRLVESTQDEARRASESLPEPVDLRQVVDASAASYSAIARSNRQELVVEGLDSLVVRGDAFRLRQVLDNLLSNAVKYTPGGGGIRVSLGVDDGGAVLTIADTGDGMTADEVARVFDPYFRTARAVVGGAPGTGLGMGIARDIVTDHDGSIEVGSAPGAGTRVTVRFPLIEEDGS